MDQQIGDGYQALDYNEVLKLQQGFGVRTSVGSGCAASAGTGLDVNVADGEILFDGTVTSVAAQTVTLSAADPDDPRKDVVYLDGTGTAQVAEGTPASALPSGERDRKTFQPSPPDLSATDAVPVAEVWVEAGVTSLSSGDIRDRRLDIDVSFGTVNAKVLDTEQFESTFYASDDAELDNILSKLSDGDRLFLGNNDFTKDRTINTDLHVIGTSGSFSGSGIRNANWQFNGFTHVSSLNLGGTATVTFAKEDSRITDCISGGSTEVIIDADSCFVTDIISISGTLTLNSGISGGFVHSNLGLNISDNTSGGYTVSDNA
jgi:hypothetical protein